MLRPSSPVRETCLKLPLFPRRLPATFLSHPPFPKAVPRGGILLVGQPILAVPLSIPSLIVLQTFESFPKLSAPSVSLR